MAARFAKLSTVLDKPPFNSTRPLSARTEQDQSNAVEVAGSRFEGFLEKFR